MQTLQNSSLLPLSSIIFSAAGILQCVPLTSQHGFLQLFWKAGQSFFLHPKYSKHVIMRNLPFVDRNYSM